MGNPIVSVVLCTYNGNRFLAEQLDSICQQTFTGLEIIIVDDASTDATYETLKSYSDKDARIRLYHNEQTLGFNLNFNRACALAMGDFIAIADQDDIWVNTKIEILLQKITEDPETVLVHCISARFEKFGHFHLKSHTIIDFSAGHDVRHFFLSNYISGHNMLLKKSLLKKTLPFSEVVYYDWWLAAVASCNGKITPVKQVLVWHRMHNSNATGTAKPKLLLYLQVLKILPQLSTIQAMKPKDRAFAFRLLQLFQTLDNKPFSLPLFLFLIKHAPVLFAHKKRLFLWLSYIKHAFKSACKSTYA